ncbi:hypothetical protein CAPTEDRAFT_209144 [Capitella teleta]|uniref:Carbohydrate sulfotransferase n=1 Tax=Capitella teleta TaxID=283909 RepID=R7T508_CAPTE|nr:hypothetical protein CAPTEDRAFT_209144 [Capitella teleta]|eukprot:ELT88093.1 hypothetical protein CAPTEDRAFT_209144 [Capitella teleta]
MEFAVLPSVSLQERTGEVTQEVKTGQLSLGRSKTKRTGNPLRKRRRGTSQDEAATRRDEWERVFFVLGKSFDSKIINELQNMYLEATTIMHNNCMCSIEYDLIVKVETLQEDSKAVLHKLGLNQSEFPLINARRTGESETLNLEKTLMEYADIGDEDMRRIHEIYDHDMQLSGYEWKDDEYKARCGAPCNQNGCC